MAGPPDRSDPAGGDVVSGRRTVLEALHAGRPLRKVLIARTAHGTIIREIVRAVRSRDVPLQFVDGRELARYAPAERHHGVVALASAKALATVDDILSAARARGEPPLVVVLDGIEDPANLGAIIRTAEGAGAHGVIIPKHRAAGLTPAAARTSAGALEYLPVAQVTNIVRTLEELKQAGLWIAGADPAADTLHYSARLVPPIALVVGGEGRGLSRLVKEHCDLLVRLPMRGRMPSLNVAVATGVLLYEVVRQHQTTTSFP